MGKQKRGNANAQRNNNAKGRINNQGDDLAEFASYAEIEKEKMSNDASEKK